MRLSDNSLDSLDRALLEKLQGAFPLVARPFQDLGQELGLAEKEALDRVRALKERGFIREIAAVLEPQALGFQTALVALKVAPEGLDAAAGIISAHPGVSHNYAREHPYNLWFTLAVPREQDLKGEALRLGEKAGAQDSLFLPTLKVFKIGALFAAGGHALASTRRSRDHQGYVPLSPQEQAVARALQQSLPLEASPFLPLAPLSFQERGGISIILGDTPKPPAVCSPQGQG